ncbi:MAG: F0F1 ATP synthase subunit A [Ruminococcus sp.]|nr:F0F1 ATP synthase subunit A [Ruminococcus sp.]MBR3900107.1 F0F1 ATP synthase subunit A [Ruminococcus sp.]
MIVPIVFGIVLKILTTPQSEGIAISGAKIFFTINLPIQNLPITESQIHSWLVMIAITGLCLFLTHGLKEKADTKRQHIAEWIVENAQKLVIDNMGDYFSGFAPFIAAILSLSAFSSLLALFGLYAPTSDVNVTAGWAILVFFLITYYKMKCGPVVYAKSFGEPVPFLAPLNIISEFATPVSMAFRHYGNVLSGSVISVLLAVGLQGLSSMVLGKLPGFLGEFPLFQIGIPAVLSIYFDVFSGVLQAYIFAMLTMLYVAGAFPADEYFRRKAKKSTI